MTNKTTLVITNDFKYLEKEKDKLNPVIYPIINSTTYKIKDLDLLDNEKYTYSRSDNPTRNLLENNLAVLENAKYALTFSSGLGVLNCLCSLNIARSGIIASHDLYGGTKRYLNKVYQHLVSYINFTNIKDNELDILFKNSSENLIWIETPSNPLLDIIDIKKIASKAKKYGKKLIVDNTFLSPIFQNPLDLGADIVCHSITKYINGTSDVVMGCAMINNLDIYNDLKFLQNAMGVVPSPFDCYLVNRNLKTLELRMKKHQENALHLAELLEKNPNIKKVIYPGLANNPYSKIISEQMSGYGGMISFYLNAGLKKSKEFLNNLKLIPVAESLGGVETLIEHPALMTHSSIDKKEREEIGISDGLIRLSVGIEDYMDIYLDIYQALNQTFNIKSKL